MRRSKRHANDAFRSSETLLGSRIPLLSLIQTLAVAEYLNFRHAANALGVAQSSVSARVKALEDDLGILVFERHARGVRLTEAGRHFVERIAAGIDQLDHAVKTAGMAAAGESGLKGRILMHPFISSQFRLTFAQVQKSVMPEPTSPWLFIASKVALQKRKVSLRTVFGAASVNSVACMRPSDFC